MNALIPTIAFACSFSLLLGQSKGTHSQLFDNNEYHPCLSQEEYESIELEINKNKTFLGLNNLNKSQGAASSTSLSWPLKPVNTSTDCDYYYVSAFVDLDPSSGIKDWNCGTRTYNGHRGIDIVPWPFIWHKMDNNLAEVIAAAAGKIITKVDGNPDRVCNGVGGGGNSNNYITIQHADGSTALYVHMKTGSLTSKTIGQTVNTGEFLGIVGSAGQSTGVHLHFEIRSDGTFANYIDPFYGPCNSTIDTSWWTSQKPYAEPKLMKLSLHSSWPYMAVCPNTMDTTYEQDVFSSSPGSEATFHACTKHVLKNDVWNFRILNPDQSVFDSWNYSSLSNRTVSTLGWLKTLPTNPGVYTFEGTFNSITCTKHFTIRAPLGIENPINNSPTIYVYPNPTKSHINFSAQTNVKLTSISGQTIANKKNVNMLDLSAQAAGIFILTLTDLNGTVVKRLKVVKE